MIKCMWRLSVDEGRAVNICLFIITAFGFVVLFRSLPSAENALLAETVCKSSLQANAFPGTTLALN